MKSFLHHRSFSICLAMFCCFVACAPITSSTQQEIVVVDDAITKQHIQWFQEDLNLLHIHVKSASSYQYRGSDEDAFLRIIDDFYDNHPGFCPLENAFFLKEKPLGLYMTVTAQGLEVALIIYDQRQKPHLTYSIVKGQLQDSINTVCLKKTNP